MYLSRRFSTPGKTFRDQNCRDILTDTLNRKSKHWRNTLVLEQVGDPTYQSYIEQFLTAYCMGSLNKDCWYMYTMKDFSRQMTSEPDQTIEILMSELDPEIMQIFHRENSNTAQEAREVLTYIIWNKRRH